jgi:hypothetical protein
MRYGNLEYLSGKDCFRSLKAAPSRVSIYADSIEKVYCSTGRIQSSTLGALEQFHTVHLQQV